MRYILDFQDSHLPRLEDKLDKKADCDCENSLDMSVDVLVCSQTATAQTQRSLSAFIVAVAVCPRRLIIAHPASLLEERYSAYTGSEHAYSQLLSRRVSPREWVFGTHATICHDSLKAPFGKLIRPTVVVTWCGA